MGAVGVVEAGGGGRGCAGLLGGFMCCIGAGERWHYLFGAFFPPAVGLFAATSAGTPCGSVA